MNQYNRLTMNKVVNVTPYDKIKNLDDKYLN